MERVGRTGPGSVFMGGTFNGAPSTLAAVLATIDELARQGTYERLTALGDHMRQGLDGIIDRLGLAAQSAGFGGMRSSPISSPANTVATTICCVTTMRSTSDSGRL